MKKEKKSDYDLNMNDYSQIYDYNLITLKVITQLWARIRKGHDATSLLYLCAYFFNLIFFTYSFFQSSISKIPRLFSFENKNPFENKVHLS